MMPDGSWQQIVTLDDAIAGGAGGLIDREELRQESSDEEFSNLYDCEFIDDSEQLPSPASPPRASTASIAGAISGPR
jgi:hypothetical protein